MFKRIKRAWILSRHPDAVYVPTAALSREDMDKVKPGDVLQISSADIEPDGKAEFFGEPTEKELLDFRREQEGTLPWYRRLTNL